MYAPNRCIFTPLMYLNVLFHPSLITQASGLKMPVATGAALAAAPGPASRAIPIAVAARMECVFLMVFTRVKLGARARFSVG